jgi:hypothetical protein
MQEQADAAVEELISSGLTATPVITAGDPKRVLLDEADAWGADCLFIGARGHNRLARFMLGSVATAVVARAHCSVEVVRMEKSVMENDEICPSRRARPESPSRRRVARRIEPHHQKRWPMRIL